MRESSDGEEDRPGKDAAELHERATRMEEINEKRNRKDNEPPSFGKRVGEEGAGTRGGQHLEKHKEDKATELQADICDDGYMSDSVIAERESTFSENHENELPFENEPFPHEDSSNDSDENQCRSDLSDCHHLATRMKDCDYHEDRKQNLADAYCDKLARPIVFEDPLKVWLIKTIYKHQIIVVDGEAGSGKMAKIPQYLHEAGFTSDGKKIGRYLPHSKAAMTEAAYVAEEMGVELGNEVGYKTHFRDCTSQRTVIKYMTNDMLLRDLKSESRLDWYSVIMVDAHKLTSKRKMLLMYLEKIMRLRPDLKLLISCDVSNTEKDFCRYLVHFYYTNGPVLHCIKSSVDLVLEIHTKKPSGDILVLLKDEEEIEVCHKMLEDRAMRNGHQAGKLVIFPVYAKLSPNMLEKIIEPIAPDTRKVVMVSNLDDTLHTIDKMMYVIDSRFTRQKTLSKESANHCASHVDHVPVGKCFQLFTARAYEKNTDTRDLQLPISKNSWQKSTLPKTKRNYFNYAITILIFIAFVISSLLSTYFLCTQHHQKFAYAVTDAHTLLGASDFGRKRKKSNRRPTYRTPIDSPHDEPIVIVDRRSRQYTIDTEMKKMFLASEKYNCSEEIVTIAAMLLVKGAVFSHHKDKITDADEARKNFNHVALNLMRVYNQWAKLSYSQQWCYENYIKFRVMKRAREIREKLVGLMKKVGIEMVSALPHTRNIRKAIISGYPHHVALLLEDGSYKIVEHQQTVVLEYESTLSTIPRRRYPISTKNQSGEYEQIDFTMGFRLEGTIDKKREPNSTGELKTNKLKEQLIAVVSEHQFIIVGGEMGCGKTIQLPRYLHEAGFTNDGKTIACVLPNREAAMFLAACAAEGMGVELGNEVGYNTPFDGCSSERTVINYMTADTLLLEMLSDRHLTSYNVIMIDEVHERTLQTELLLGSLKSIARERPDLKLLTSTGTLDAETFSDFFEEAPTIKIPERRYPVDIFYTKEPVLDYIDACVDTVLQIHAKEPSGDILIFLPNQEDIEACQEKLEDCTTLLILPLHENLPSVMLKYILHKVPLNVLERKVVLATKIAESLSTIDDIVYVIDSGMDEQKNINSRTGLDMLMNVPISKTSANRRACRAGLVAPGKCFRLYTAEDYENEITEHTVPEINRMNLSNAVLMLKALGIENLLHFDFLNPPPRETLVFALEQLYALGALGRSGELTSTGRRMAVLPVDPMMAKMLLASEKYNCSAEIVTIAAMLLVKGAVFFRPMEEITDANKARKNFNHVDGDHFSLMQVYNQWTESGYSEQWCYQNYIKFRSMKRAREIRGKLVGLMQKVGIGMVSSLPDTTNIRKAIFAGYFYHVAHRSDSPNYKLVKHVQPVVLQLNSALSAQQPRLVLYHELVIATKVYMRFVIDISAKQVLDLAPHYYNVMEFVKFGRASVEEGALHEFWKFS